MAEPLSSLAPPSRDESFVSRHDVGGWDECFPTLARTTIGTRFWPDHGDLWWRPWQVESSGERLRMWVHGDGYHFQRTIEGKDAGFRLSYSVTNETESPFPYLWCAHPLLSLESPLTIELSARPRVLLGNDSYLGRKGEEFRWPVVGGRTFHLVGKPSKLAAKLFVEVHRGKSSSATAIATGSFFAGQSRRRQCSVSGSTRWDGVAREPRHTPTWGSNLPQVHRMISLKLWRCGAGRGFSHLEKPRHGGWN